MIRMNTLSEILLSLLMFGVFMTAASAQTLHTIIFAATEDATIGKGSEQSYELLNTEIENIANLTGMESELYYRTGRAFNISNFNRILSRIKTNITSKDVILFYFLGHGYEGDKDYPNLLFTNTSGTITQEDLNESSKSLEEISKELNKMKARLTIVIGESCNNKLDLDQSIFSGNKEVISAMKSPTPIERTQYQRLFRYAEGSLLISSSRRGQPSYISQTQGGAFTKSFIDALHTATRRNRNGKASWVDLISDARDRTREFAQKKDFEVIQTPQFKVVKSIRYLNVPSDEKAGAKPQNTFWMKLVAFFAPNKVERAFNKSIKSGELLDLETILSAQGEEGDKMKEKMLAQNPVTFYMAQAMIFEEKEDTVNALLHYSIAYELGKNNRTKRDQVLIERIKKLNGKHGAISDFNEAKNYQTWLKSKFTQHRAYYENDISVIDDRITKIQNLIQNIESDITERRTTIADIEDVIDEERKQIEEIRNEIRRLDVKRTQKVEVKLSSMKKTSKETIKKIEALMDRIEREGIVDNQQQVMVDDATVEFQFAKRNTASNLEPVAKGYVLGQHCTKDIQETTHDLMKLLLRPVKDVPDRSVLKVKMKIVGNADWIGGGDDKLLSIWYTGEKDIFHEFMNKEGETQIFKISKGEERRITNEELAFLRAYCAYNIIIDLLEAEGIKDYMVQFQGIEHEMPDSLMGDDPGAPYRGIDIDMTIENLFKHYVDKIKELESDVEDVKFGIVEKKKEIRNLRREIEQKENEISAKTAEIEREENQKKKLQEILQNALITKGLDSKAKKEVEKVKKLQQGE